MRERGEYALAVLVQLIGAAGALLAATRAWQTVLTSRPRPFRDDVLHLSGRTVDAAPTALALVALAGVIAVIATRGWVRRMIGGVVALAGALLVWRSFGGLDAVSAARARTLVADKHSGVEIGASTVHVDVTSTWAVLSAICGALVLLAGLLVVLRGHRWGAMSARYDGPAAAEPADVDPEQARTKANASLWTALDRGDDPTRADPR
jgi:uncharacterized membrane protein (TIGR02234 family)